jgi:hypothetical protein
METRKLSRSWRSRILSFLIAVSLCAGFTVFVSQGWSEEYDPRGAGHPLRLVAYVLHPVGVLLDYCLLRPAYRIVQKEPFTTIFGAQKRYYRADEERPEERP